MKLSKIGDVYFSATTEEKVTHDNEITDKPVEDLGYISDHIKAAPTTFDVTGVIVGTDAYPKLKQLREYMYSKQILTYHGRNIMSNVVIQSFSTEHGKDIRNGFNFTMTCKIIRVAVSQTLTEQTKDPCDPSQIFPTKTQTSEMKNMGKVVDIEKETDKEQYEIYKQTEEKNVSKMLTKLIEEKGA